MVTMWGWLRRARAWASWVKRWAKLGSCGDLRGEDFEGDDAVEGFLAGFVDGAHAAAAEEGEECRGRGRRGRVVRGWEGSKGAICDLKFEIGDRRFEI